MRVAGLWRYPVKSLQGEAVQASMLDERGLLGDRAYALVDRATGFVASAKHPRKWSGLLQCRAAYAHEPQPGAPLPPVLITLPDGAEVRSTDADVHERLSQALQRDVQLTTTPPARAQREADRTPLDAQEPLIREEALAVGSPAGGFFDYAPLHLLSDASLRRLQHDHASELPIELARFRPNVLLHVPDEDGYVDGAWLGREAALGSARVRFIDPCPRCVIVTSAQAGGFGRDAQLLRTLARHNNVASFTLAPGRILTAVLGAYAHVVRPGIVRAGDLAMLAS